MKTLLSILVLLAVVSSSFGQFRVAPTNATYIAYRGDGRGTGSVTDPYDGSTANKLDTILSNAPAGETIYFYPSLDYVSQPYALSGAGTGVRRYNHKDSQRYIGLGDYGSVRITLSTNTPIGAVAGVGMAFFGETPYGVTNVLWKNIWFNGNYTNYYRNGKLSNAFSAIVIYGDYNTVEDCKVTGMWGTYGTGGKEGFPLFLYTGHPTLYTSPLPYTGGNVVRRTTLINDVAGLSNGVQHAWSYINGINAFGRQTVSTNSSQFPTNWSPGIVEQCLVVDNGRAMVSGVGGDIVRGNTVVGAPLFYQDTWRQGKYVIEDNYNIAPSNACIVFKITTNGPISASVGGPFTIRGNTLRRLTNGAAGASTSDSIIYFESTPSFRAAEANGATNWIGFTDVEIIGNRFTGDASGNAARTPGIGGQFNNLRVVGNDFENVSFALWQVDQTTNTFFSGNTVRNSRFAVFANSRGAMRGSGLAINVNTFENISLVPVLYSGVDNVSIHNNIFHDFGVSSGDGNQIAVWAGTNMATYTGSSADNSYPFTNLTVSGNTFDWNRTNGWFSVIASNVAGLQIYGNSDRSLFGMRHGTASSVGVVTEGAIYITNAVGLAGVYTNGVLLTPAAGGSESTAPGTNLVMAGTTLSLSNSIINDSTKSRSNSTYLGGALTAGQWASWSSNGTLHFTAPHGSVLTLGSNGVILTNGTALAGGGGSQTPWAQNIDAASYNLNSLGTIRWAANNGGFLAYLTNDGDSGIYSPNSNANGGFWLSSDGYSNIVLQGGVVDLRRVQRMTMLNGTQYTTNGNLLATDGSGNVYSAGTISNITIQLAGMSSNQIVVTGEDGQFTNLVLNADQFVTNVGTASGSPSLAIKSGVTLTNAFIDAAIITNVAVVTNGGRLNVTNGGIANFSHGSLIVPGSFTFTNGTGRIRYASDTAFYFAPTGTDRLALSGSQGSAVYFNNTVNGQAGLYWNTTTLDANSQSIGGSGNNAMRISSFETNNHRGLLFNATNSAANGGTNWVMFTTQTTNAVAGATTTNLVIYFTGADGSARRGTIQVNIAP